MSERAYGRLLDRCEKLEAEIERLQAELDTAEIAKVKLLAEVDQLRTENQQLRAMIEKIEPLTTLGLKVAKVMPRPPEQ